jgi:hypothetical protein
MAGDSDRGFYDEIGYDLNGSMFDRSQYELLARSGAAAFHRDPQRWTDVLDARIQQCAQWSRDRRFPLVTTEGWALINWKDGPGLEWDWIKGLTAHGVRSALRTERWAAMTTSNFCGPQFVGMWDDVEWHRELTGEIHAGRLPHL